MSDSGFAIDILAQIQGAGTTTDQIIALARSLEGAKKVTGPFDQAIARVQADLSAAGQAAAQANAGLSDAENLYKQLEVAANKAAKAAERGGKRNDNHVLLMQADAAKSALEAQAAVVDQARAKAAEAATTQEQLAASLGTVRQAAQDAAKAQKQAAEEAAQAEIAKAEAVQQAAAEQQKAAEKQAEAARKAAEEQRKAAEDAAEAVEEAAKKQADAAKKADDKTKAEGQAAALELMGERAQKAKKAMSVAEAIGPWGALVVAVAAVAAAFVVLGGAIAFGAAKLSAFAINAVDAAQETRTLLDTVAGSAAAGADLSDMVGRVAAKSPQATAEIAKLAEGLYKSGKRGAELEKALQEASYEASGLGKNPGPDQLAAKMGSMKVLGLKLSENIAAIFAGPQMVKGVQAFQKDLREIVDMFSLTSTTGRGLQAVMGAIFPSLMNGAHGAVPAIKALITGLVLGALKVAIVFVQVRNAVRQAFAGTALGDLNMMKIGMNVLYGAAVIGAVALVAFGVVVGMVAASLAMFVNMVSMVGRAVAKAFSLVSSAKDALAATDFGSVAASMIDGLVNGITSGAGRVFAAITSMGAGMVSAAMKALDSHSPSKKFFRVGLTAPQGVVQGVDTGARQVDQAVSNMLTPPSAAPGLVPNGGSQTSTSNSSVNVTVNVYGSGMDIPSLVGEFELSLRRVFSGMAEQMGAPA